LPLTEERAKGAFCADVGCGSGRASIKLAKEFPQSRQVGFDVADAQLSRACENANRAGVEERVRFEKLDVASGLLEKYDVVTTFDVFHDAVDPLGLLQAIREGLKASRIRSATSTRSGGSGTGNAGRPAEAAPRRFARVAPKWSPPQIRPREAHCGLSRNVRQETARLPGRQARTQGARVLVQYAGDRGRRIPVREAAVSDDTFRDRPLNDRHGRRAQAHASL
jgi:SAM-dependent methyltransferase